MADPRRFKLEDLVIRPGTYFNPQTEVLIVVDDSPELDPEIFDLEDHGGADWVLVAEETPLDESLRDELLERFQSEQLPGSRVDDAEALDRVELDEDELDAEDYDLGDE
jgi:hypothetical protein